METQWDFLSWRLHGISMELHGILRSDDLHLYGGPNKHFDL